MKTIEFTKLYRSKKTMNLLKKLYRHGYIEHFLFEPQLIIRTSNLKGMKKILKGVKDYKVYDYPYPKDKKNFGESKRIEKWQGALEILLGIQTILTLRATPKQKAFFMNRVMHCFLNMNGYEYNDEAKYYLSQANGYMVHQYKADGKIITFILAGLIKLLYKLL